MPSIEPYTRVLGFAHVLLLYLYQFHIFLPVYQFVSLSLSTFIMAGGLRGNYEEFQTVVLETWDSPPTVILQINSCGLNWTHTLRSTEQLKVNTGENFCTHAHVDNTYACARTHLSTRKREQERTDMQIGRMNVLSKHACTNTRARGHSRTRTETTHPRTPPQYTQ